MIGFASPEPAADWQVRLFVAARLEQGQRHLFAGERKVRTPTGKLYRYDMLIYPTP